MKEKTIEKLNSYYYISLLNSYIFSDDLYEKLRQRNIIAEEWFIDYMNTLIIFYSKFNALSYNERDNCFIMLNQFLLNSIDKKNVDMVSICNHLIRSLNSSSDKNSEYFLRILYLNSCINPNLEEKILKQNNCNLDFLRDYFKEFYYYASLTATYLIQENCEELGIELLANEFYFNSIVNIVNSMPDILKDEEVFVKMMALLYANDNVTVKGKPLFFESPRCSIKNAKMKKYLRKSYKNINCCNKKKNF